MKIAIIALGIVFSLSTAGSGRAANYRDRFWLRFRLQSPLLLLQSPLLLRHACSRKARLASALRGT